MMGRMSELAQEIAEQGGDDSAYDLDCCNIADENYRLAHPEEAWSYILHLQRKYRPIYSRTDDQYREIERATDIANVADMRAGKKLP